MESTKVCPKCQGIMEIGNYSGNTVNWQVNTDQNFLQQSGKQIITYACKKCGYLESYVKK